MNWRPQAFLLLDRKFSEFPHLHATTNPGGDYEVRCSKCGQVETYLGAGDRDADALTFALHVTGLHTIKKKNKMSREQQVQSQGDHQDA